MQKPLINNLDYNARRALILGVSGTGKSTITSRMIYTHPAELVLIYDWDGLEFSRRLGGKVATSREEVAELIESGQRLICYDAEANEPDVQGEGFEWFCSMVYEVGGVLPGRKLMVVDECHELIDPYNMPEYLGKVLTGGRRRMIDSCLIGRSANALENEARDQVNELYCFRLLDDASLKYPKAMGLDPDEIKSLPDTHFIYKDLRTGHQERLDLWGQKRNGS